MNIYLAAAFTEKKQMLLVRRDLQAHFGHSVTSRWILSASEEGLKDAAVRLNPERALRGCLGDLEDIDASDMVAVFTDVPSTSGGLNVELGYSIARRKEISVIGPLPNVFFTWPGIRHFDYYSDFLKSLAE